MLFIITLYSLFGAVCFCIFEQENELRMLVERNETRQFVKNNARRRLISDLQVRIYDSRLKWHISVLFP